MGEPRAKVLIRKLGNAPLMNRAPMFRAQLIEELQRLLDENERLRRDFARLGELTEENRLFRDLEQADKDNDQLQADLAAAREREKGLRGLLGEWLLEDGGSACRMDSRNRCLTHGLTDCFVGRTRAALAREGGDA